LSKARERDSFFALHDQIDRVFDEFTRGFGLPSFGERSAGWPSVEVKEDQKQMCVEAELPGLDKDDIEVVLTDNVLTIRGEKRVELCARSPSPDLRAAGGILR
jgi:HSP20 family protein